MTIEEAYQKMMDHDELIKEVAVWDHYGNCGKTEARHFYTIFIKPRSMHYNATNKSLAESVDVALAQWDALAEDPCRCRACGQVTV